MEAMEVLPRWIQAAGVVVPQSLSALWAYIGFHVNYLGQWHHTLMMSAASPLIDAADVLSDETRSEAAGAGLGPAQPET